VRRVDLDFLSVFEQNAGVNIIDLAARAATGVEPAPGDDAETATCGSSARSPRSAACFRTPLPKPQTDARG